MANFHTLTSAYCLIALRLLVLGNIVIPVISHGQTTITSLAALGMPVYLKPSTVPMTHRAPLSALGSRLQTPGNERFLLAGTYSDSNGSKGIRITWELPGKTRVDVGSSSIVYDGTKVGGNGTLTDQENDLMESLGDDRPETPLYGLKQLGFAERCLGGWYRTDNGTTQNYMGPFYTIYETVAPTFVRSDRSSRRKLWLFDSRTGLFLETRYDITRNGATINVSTRWSGWTKVNGNAVPAQIVRQENETTVFTVNISSGVTSASANDGIFVTP